MAVIGTQRPITRPKMEPMDEAGDDPVVPDDLMQEQGADDGDEHPEFGVEHAAARGLGMPARTRDPMSEMPEMALVADMSGVWRSGGTRLMT
jgi:hypothetical protein